MDFERTVELSCVGENTGLKYTGTFVIKLFLSHNDKLKITREIKSKLGDIQSIVSNWNINAFMGTLKSCPESPCEDNVFMTPETQQFLFSLLYSYLPDVPRSSSLLSDIIILNAHIVSAPDFWKKSNNGFDLYDEQPVVQLMKDLNELTSSLFEKNKASEE